MLFRSDILECGDILKDLRLGTYDSFMSCTVHELPEKVDAQALTVEERASIRIMTDKFIEYAALTNQITDEIVDRTLADNEPASLVDRIAAEIDVSTVKKQAVLEAEPFAERVLKLIGIITEENEIAAIEKQLNQKVKESVDNNQKEYFLKERMKVIQEELGEDEDAQAEADEWLSKLDELKLDEKVD